MKILILFLVPILTVLSAFFMYKFVGSKRFLQMDLVQFILAFVYMPILLIWSKSFLYYVLSNEIDIRLSPRDLLFFDTTLTLILFYTFSFIVIHSLTKSFSIRKKQDPLYDIFELSEYFHMSLSHIVIYGGMIVITSFFSLINIFFPLVIELNRFAFYGIFGFGIISGLIALQGIIMFDAPDAKFMKIMKLFFGATTTTHIVAYFFFDIPFQAQYLIFWYVFPLFISLSFAVYFVERSEKANNFFFKIKNFFDNIY